MKKLFIITGADGHLGSTIIKLLIGKDILIRALILPNESEKFTGIEYYRGDVRDIKTIMPIFIDSDKYETYVIHTAGIISIADNVSNLMYDVNVNGTKNIIDLCRINNVKRLLYVSSVHAIPVKNDSDVIHETTVYSSKFVDGGYAKTKAEATQAILSAAKSGLDAVVVNPSGIIGPYGTTNNHLLQMINDYISGKLPAGVNGGYDFVDVRDVAYGCIQAVYYGKKGESYILSNRHYSINELLKIVKNITGGKRLPMLPIWMAKAAAPVFEWYSSIKNKRPLYTRYSLNVLKSDDKFSHDKATRELSYYPRDLSLTLKDTIKWMKRTTSKA